MIGYASALTSDLTFRPALNSTTIQPFGLGNVGTSFAQAQHEGVTLMNGSTDYMDFSVDGNGDTAWGMVQLDVTFEFVGT